MPLPTSCGTLIVNSKRQLLLCHVTNTDKWDIPKGMQDLGESTVDAALRELFEESGLKLDAGMLMEIGDFDYRRDKRLHLYKVNVPDDFINLGHLKCTSFFPHHVTGKMMPEANGFCWASQADIKSLCWPNMAKRLLSLEW